MAANRPMKMSAFSPCFRQRRLSAFRAAIDEVRRVCRISDKIQAYAVTTLMKPPEPTAKGPIMRIETSFLFDLDGTLVDSVYQHVLAWKESLDAEGVPISVWRIHRRIGMSGGLFLNMLLRETGIAMSEETLLRLRHNHAAAYGRLAAADAVRPLPGARELLDFL